MGRLRTAVHTLADLELSPEEILYHLNELVSHLEDDCYATCLYALYDPSTPDGTTYFPDMPANPPLGAGAPPFETSEMRIPDDGLLVLYTDGLVESATCDIGRGMSRLARTLSTAWRPDASQSGTAELDRVCDRVTGALLPADLPTPDDAALLVARLRALSPGDIASWPLPEHPRAAALARNHVRRQLSAWGLDELTMSTELLVSELVGNVVRHAKGPIALRLVRSRCLTCEVSDGSPTTPRIRRASETDEGGRGLQLVAALSQRWGTRYTPEGKCIWTEQALPGHESGLASGMPSSGRLVTFG
jgi:hypothetical protein